MTCRVRALVFVLLFGWGMAFVPAQAQMVPDNLVPDSLAVQLDQARRRGDRLAQSNVLILIAERTRNAPRETRLYLREALALADTEGHAPTIALAAARRIFPEYLQGNYLTALSLARRAQPLLDSLGMKAELARMLLSVGSTYSRMGDYATARNELTLGLALAREVGDRRTEAGFLNNLGETYKREGNYASALHYYQLSLDLTKEIGRPIYVQLDNLGEVNTYLGDLKLAREQLTQSLAISRSQPDPRLMAASLCNLGRVELQQGSPVRAILLLNEAISLARAQNLIERAMECANLLHRAYRELGELKLAYVAQAQYIDLVDTLDARQSRLAYADLRASLTVERAEADIARLKRQSQTDMILQWSLAGGVALIVTLGLVLAGINRRRNEDLLLITRQNEQSQEAQRKLEAARHELQLQNSFLAQTFGDIRLQNEAITESHRQLDQQSQNLMASLEYASRIQRAVLPDADRLSAVFQEWFLLNQPRDVVAGSFIWLQESSERAVFAIGSCDEYGVPGALVGTVVDSILTQLVLDRGIIDAGSILTEFDRSYRRLVRKENQTGSLGLSVGVVVIERRTRSIYFAGAQIPLYYVHKGRLFCLRGNRYKVADSAPGPTPEFVANYVMYDAQHRFFIGTDGLAQQLDALGQRPFGEQRVSEFLLNTSSLSLPDQRLTLLDELTRWRGPTPQTADYLMIGFTPH